MSEREALPVRPQQNLPAGVRVLWNTARPHVPGPAGSHSPRALMSGWVREGHTKSEAWDSQVLPPLHFQYLSLPQTAVRTRPPYDLASRCDAHAMMRMPGDMLLGVSLALGHAWLCQSKRKMRPICLAAGGKDPRSG